MSDDLMKSSNARVLRGTIMRAGLRSSSDAS